MTESRSELLKGTLDMLVLKTLALEPMHGWGVSERIRQISQDVFQVNQGSLYPALQRLKRKGWIRSQWRVTENNRRARYYTLTAAGRRQLDAERREWERSVSAVNRILRTAQ
ncbi:MAG: PadR family transcriptional regulator [Gemmatimonadetes bacterium]|nr:PadR family transcriptional regulator [Gemmatimonadota bacterium]MCH7777512.1 PadR family transcriptional regulator [Gemmatimonadota bacterium]